MQVNWAMQTIRAIQAVQAKHVAGLVIQARLRHYIVLPRPARPSLTLAWPARWKDCMKSYMNGNI